MSGKDETGKKRTAEEVLAGAVAVVIVAAVIIAARYWFGRDVGPVLMDNIEKIDAWR